MTTPDNSTSPIAGRVILITGGTGSFGTTMAQHLTNGGAAEVRILSRDEAKQDAMRHRFPDHPFTYFIGDVREADSMAVAFEGADMVFHAAALKQVPSCEFFPMQAVRTNVIGSDNVLTLAARSTVQSVVMLSTDKAVTPVNAMGISKSMMEKVAFAAARSRTKPVISVVRYGNVLMSRGSVVPLFLQQIALQKQLTVTDPKMTRFLMPLSQAVSLVEWAFTHAQPGDLFVRKAPGVTIGNLAEAVQRLCGVERDVHVIGTRHAEKLHETLATREELHRSEDHGEYLRIGMDDRSLDYSRYFAQGETFLADQDYTSEVTERMTVEDTMAMLEAVPEFVDEAQRLGLR
jgi:UDP-N-acetylglucosamine 4,6-dehydratase/5-epimerase